MPGLLCILAHPDDETFCSGLLTELVGRGVTVRLLCLTRGEGGTLGHPPVATRETLGRVREEEMRRAARTLGAAEVAFLGYVDPVAEGGRLREPAHDAAHLQQEIGDALARYRPEVVLTHGSNGDYGHPAHRLAHRVVRAAVVAAGPSAPLLYTFNATFPKAERPGLLNPDDPAHIILDVASLAEARAALLACHASQLDVFVGPQEGEEAYRRAAVAYFSALPRETYHRRWPPIRGRHRDVLTAWLGLQAGSSAAARHFAALRGRARKCGRMASRKLRQLRAGGRSPGTARSTSP